jgi:hypothetical protein
LRAAVPAVDFDLERHAQVLDEIYARAKASPRPVPCAPVVDPARRVRFLLWQRETAQMRLGAPRDP